MRRLRSGLLLVALSLAGCRDVAPARVLPETFQPQLLLGESGEALEAGQSSTRFNFGYLRDLWVRVKVAAVPRTTRLTLTFVNPDGQVFYTDSVPFSTDPEMHEMAETSTTNAGHPLTVYTARVVDGGVVLERSIPISGTVFQRVPADGVWAVRAVVEGVPGMLTTSMEVAAVR